jgi:glycosyltransferase involved in cell wall biosynthesis
MTRRWIVAQVGSREHYAVPRTLEAHGVLDLFLTDYWCRRGRRLLAAGPASWRAIAGRWHPDIPAEKVTSFNRSVLIDALCWRWRTGMLSNPSLEYLRVGRNFGSATVRALRRRRMRSDSHAFFAYCTAALEPLEFLAGQGIPTVVGQIDPARTHVDMVRQEQQKWPGWEARQQDVAEAYWERLRAEWRAATLVLVNSAWSQAALVQQGVPPEKIIVVPLAYEGGVQPRKAVNFDRPLSVLFLGNVSVGKGIQYLVEAAKMLLGEKITFTVAGPIAISKEAMAAAPPNLAFLGRITRDRLDEVYGRADVFVFPTLSDGFGITQLEAMANGLPVIATPRCGSVVQDGRNGFTVPPGDSEAIAAAVLRLARDRRLLAEMSASAQARAAHFSLDNYFTQLTNALSAKRICS